MIAWFLLLAGFLAAARVRTDPAVRWPHIIGAAAALLGCVVFIIGNRRCSTASGAAWEAGTSGTGLPGFSIAFDDLAVIPAGSQRVLLLAAGAFVVVANLLYFSTALRFYG